MFLRGLNLCARQVDLVDDGDDGQLIVESQLGVGQGLGLDALRGVNDEQGSLASCEAARDLVRKVNVTRGVNQVELVFAPVPSAIEQAHGVGLDGNAALSLEIHGIQDLVRHLALGERACLLEQPVSQRGLAVINMGDNREVADGLRLGHGNVVSLLPGGAKGRRRRARQPGGRKMSGANSRRSPSPLKI